MEDIKILGGGLSGLIAAINLAKEGYEVEVYEKNKDVGMRFHGDLEGMENWSGKKDIIEELKEMNIEINFDCDPFSHVTVTNCVERREVYNERPLFYLVKRGSFRGTLDFSLKEQALRSGVVIHFEKTLPHDKADIVATGPVPDKVMGIVKGVTFETDAEDTVVLVLNDELAYRGYAYLLITKGYGSTCTVVFNELYRVNDCFRKMKEFFVEKFSLDMQSPKEVGGIGSFSLKKVFRKGDALYVGEAAGLQDFLWGFGMRFAIKSGYLASQSIINNDDYVKIAEKHFRNKSKASIVNRYLWEKLSKKNFSFCINNAEFIRKNINSIYSYNLPQRIIYPLALSYFLKKYRKLS